MVKELKLDRESNIVMLENDMVTLKELLTKEDDESKKKSYILMGIIWGRILLMTNMYIDAITDEMEESIEEFSNICRQNLKEKEVE
mgnify:FL=1